MGELKEICSQLNLPSSGKKVMLINRVVEFITTGNILKDPVIPEVSLAKKGNSYPLSKDTLILKGAYKNDLKTRLFFKKLIGKHFHFTAFGLDWIMEQWLKGKPPTYQEFAHMWQYQYEQAKLAPKKEWAYINFIQNLIKQHPNLSKTDQLNAWKQEQAKQKKVVDSILKNLIK